MMSRLAADSHYLSFRKINRIQEKPLRTELEGLSCVSNSPFSILSIFLSLSLLLTNISTISKLPTVPEKERQKRKKKKFNNSPPPTLSLSLHPRVSKKSLTYIFIFFFTIFTHIPFNITCCNYFSISKKKRKIVLGEKKLSSSLFCLSSPTRFLYRI